MGRGRSVQRKSAVSGRCGGHSWRNSGKSALLWYLVCFLVYSVHLKMPRSSPDRLNKCFREFYVMELQQLGEHWSQLLIAVCSFLI